jgi:hypothetical protein
MHTSSPHSPYKSLPFLKNNLVPLTTFKSIRIYIIPTIIIIRLVAYTIIWNLSVLGSTSLAWVTQLGIPYKLDRPKSWLNKRSMIEYPEHLTRQSDLSSTMLFLVKGHWQPKFLLLISIRYTYGIFNFIFWPVCRV